MSQCKHETWRRPFCFVFYSWQNVIKKYRGNNICFVLSTREGERKKCIFFFSRTFSFHIVQQQTWEKRRSPFANYFVLKPIIRVNSKNQFTKLVQIVLFPFSNDSNQYVLVVKVLLNQPLVCAKRRKERLEPKGIKCEKDILFSSA